MKRDFRLTIVPALAACMVSAAALAACDDGSSYSSTPTDGVQQAQTEAQRAANDSRICVDGQNHRVPDNQCGSGYSTGGGSNAFLWYYLGTLNNGGHYYNRSELNRSYPIGSSVHGGAYTAPVVSRSAVMSSPTYSARASAYSASVSSRGGFGSSAAGRGGSFGG